MILLCKCGEKNYTTKIRFCLQNTESCFRLYSKNIISLYILPMESCLCEKKIFRKNYFKAHMGGVNNISK